MMAVVWNSRPVGWLWWRPELVIPSLDEPRHGHSGLGQEARGSWHAAPTGSGSCPGDRIGLWRLNRTAASGTGLEGGAEGAGASAPALRRGGRRSSVRGASVRVAERSVRAELGHGEVAGRAVEFVSVGRDATLPPTCRNLRRESKNRDSARRPEAVSSLAGMAIEAWQGLRRAATTHSRSFGEGLASHVESVATRGRPGTDTALRCVELSQRGDLCARGGPGANL